jgi:toxin ParE1/3/4
VHHVSLHAKADLDRIWQYICEESGSAEIADRQIDAIIERFFLLAAHPRAGRTRDDDLGPGRRSFPADSYVIVYRIEGADVLILRVAHSRQGIRVLMSRTGEGR